jgi:hypothetical protein
MNSNYTFKKLKKIFIVDDQEKIIILSLKKVELESRYYSSHDYDTFDDSIVIDKFLDAFNQSKYIYIPKNDESFIKISKEDSIILTINKINEEINNSEKDKHERDLKLIKHFYVIMKKAFSSDKNIRFKLIKELHDNKLDINIDLDHNRIFREIIRKELESLYQEIVENNKLSFLLLSINEFKTSFSKDFQERLVNLTEYLLNNNLLSNKKEREYSYNYIDFSNDNLAALISHAMLTTDIFKNFSNIENSILYSADRSNFFFYMDFNAIQKVNTERLLSILNSNPNNHQIILKFPLLLELIRRNKLKEIKEFIKTKAVDYIIIDSIDFYFENIASSWAYSYEEEFKQLINYLLEDNTKDYTVFSKIINVLKLIENNNDFYLEPLYLFKLLSKELASSISKIENREFSEDYMNFAYVIEKQREARYKATFDETISYRDLSFLNSGVIGSDVFKINILLNAMFDVSNRDSFINEDNIRLFLREGFSAITGDAIPSEKKRYIRILSSIIHGRVFSYSSQQKIPKKYIKIFVEEISKTSIRNSVIEKIFSISEEYSYNRETNKKLFFGLDYSDFSDTIKDVSHRQSIDSVVLLAGLN